MKKFKEDKIKMEDELKGLQDNLDKCQKEMNVKINEKEREKIQATEKLRKEMLFKIKETKANLLALNDTQL